MANQIKKDNAKDIIKDTYAFKEVKYYRDLAKKAADSKKGIEEITKNLSNLSGKELENAIKQIEQYEEVLSSSEKSMEQFVKKHKDLNTDFHKTILEQAKNVAEGDELHRKSLENQETDIKNLQDKIKALKANREEALKKNDDAKANALEQQIQAQESTLKDKLKEYTESKNDPKFNSKDKSEIKLSGSLSNSGLLKGMLDGFKEPGQGSKSTEVLTSALESKLGNASPLAKGLGGLLTITGKILDVTSAVRRSIDGWVDDAARVISNYYGKINASLEGATKDFSSISANAVESLGLSRFVKQTDYIEQIARLTASGVSFNVEQRALLETIKDKTIASFSAVDANLLRLIRLRQQDLTATQFGLEAALRTTLNKVFKDSTYLNELYDTINGAITDAAIVSGSSDITEYNSTIQSWMGAMYESGVSSGVVQKLAQGINYLGSGNVAGLASDADLQRLILLSMDSINMDYADILQRGLSSSDINDLLTAVVKYLTQIAKNTSDNNVLASSYTNLFSMSMSDLKAITNLYNNLGSWSTVNSSSALDKTKKELSYIQSTERTTVAEQVQNIMDNAKYTFGQSIAKDAGSYLTWKVSNLMIDVFDSVTQTVGTNTKLGKIAQAAKLVPQIGIFGNELKGILSIASAIGSMSWGNEALNTYINGSPSYGGGNSTSVSAAVTSAGSNGTFKTVSMKDISSSGAYTTAATQYSAADWASEEEVADEQLAELKNITSALVQSDAEDAHKAFATYLVGLTDNTLRSFASIFADEDAMNETFTGENSTLKDNLFKYAEDTTSNSTKSEPQSI